MSERFRPGGFAANDEIASEPEVPFHVDGRTVMAREGEPLAIALLASGVRIFRTMPHTGEPRGGYCLVGRCTDCLMIVDGQPNVRTCLTPVAPGMVVQTQHGLGERDEHDPFCLGATT